MSLLFYKSQLCKIICSCRYASKKFPQEISSLPKSFCITLHVNAEEKVFLLCQQIKEKSSLETNFQKMQMLSLPANRKNLMHCRVIYFHGQRLSKWSRKAKGLLDSFTRVMQANLLWYNVFGVFFFNFPCLYYCNY